MFRDGLPEIVNPLITMGTFREFDHGKEVEVVIMFARSHMKLMEGDYFRWKYFQSYRIAEVISVSGDNYLIKKV